jgi:hypothetical protein
MLVYIKSTLLYVQHKTVILNWRVVVSFLLAFDQLASGGFFHCYIYHVSYELTYLNQRIRRMSWSKISS